MNDSEALSRSKPTWIVSPIFDLLFFTNIAWTIYLIPGVSNRNETAFDFWQIYFVTLPHRWLTLFVVLADADRRVGKGQKLTTIALLMGLMVAGTYWFSGDFLCLAVIDFVWNAWHFAAQHWGIFSIYGKKNRITAFRIEKYSFLVFIAYCILSTPGWAEAYAFNQQFLLVTDALILSFPILLLTLSVTDANRRSKGRFAYLASVCCLYLGMLVATRLHAGKWILIFSSASALFHATEYLAITSHYSWNRRNVGSEGIFRQIANSWLSVLVIYIVAVGSMGVILDSGQSPLRDWWIGLNLWAAFTHYTFDSLIWKLRNPSTSLALGVHILPENQS